MQTSKSFLGTGWSFPPIFDAQKEAIQMVSEEEDIKQSLHILLSTVPGERAMKPNYGCDLQRINFQVINTATDARIRELIDFAILYFEPRITLEEIIIDHKDSIKGIIYLEIYYTIRKVNVRSNIVFPYYINEGTEVTEI